MSNEEQMKPADWAKKKNVLVDIVMKHLRESGATVRTHFSPVPLSQLNAIESKVVEENNRMLARKKAATPDSSAAAPESPAPKKKTASRGEVSTNVVKGGVKVSVRRTPGASASAPKASPPKPHAPAAPAAKASAEPKVHTAPAAPAPEKKSEPAAAVKKPAAHSAPVHEKKAESATPPKPVTPAAPAASVSKPAEPAKTFEPKTSAMKAQVFKPDAAVLARIEKSKQMASQAGAGQNRNRFNKDRNGSRPAGNNQQGYTGTFGRTPASATGGQNNRPGGNRPAGNRTGGFSGSSMQDAFGAARTQTGAAFMPQAPAKGATGGNRSSSGGKRDKGKQRGADFKNERQKEQQEVVRQNVSRVMASLSKNPVKKVYHKEHSEEDGGVEKPVLKTSDFITIAELAGMMDLQPNRVIAKCMEMGMNVNRNSRLDFETIQIIGDEFGYDVQLMDEYEASSLGLDEDAPEDMVPRPPVVTVMGHVDHGKTSLLDWIRKANVVSKESGGITQHMGAYEVTTPVGKVTFLDTPGHEAFSAMRARGSRVTDVIVLVVAADSMVMPQTVESIELAHREKVPIVVAITKIDLPTANVDKIRAQLADRGVEVEQWGGTTSCIEVSARTGQGMEKLLETLALETEILELKANPNTHARGAVVESKLDVGKGSMATVLIQNGTLHVGDPFVCGIHYGRVRAMFDDRGNPVKEAPPSSPCQVLGFDGTPQAGDDLIVMEDEKTAREFASRRRMEDRERKLRARATLDRAREGNELRLIVKADTGGSAEAIAAGLEKLSNREVSINILQKGVGAISDTEIQFASQTNAIIIAFHIMPTLPIRSMAEKEGVEIKTYRVIYDIFEDVKNAVEGLLKPITREEMVGEAEIRQVFKIPKVGLIAGCMVIDGEVNRNSQVRVYRDGVELGSTVVQSLKREKEDVSSVRRGFECGIGLRGYENIKEGDTLMFFKEVKVARTLADVAREEKEAAEAAGKDNA
ncbi:MAG: translation initiation factor IF-2 [Fibrobacter sp.]|jgi:translation initiation factor IF-2|nr:translation initiation factor IF-2 [Fibrobacter sp.]